jgi:FkbM family methyltransferase
MLKKLFRKIAPAPRLVHIPVGCPPLQHYPGYLPEDTDLVSRYACGQAVVKEDHYIDGFGVRTDFKCVPFVNPACLDIERLQLPLPDDGFHAEGIEYAALLDAFDNRKAKCRFTAVEVGSGWGPWIGLAGVLANTHGADALCLIGAEASAERYALMCRHLERNGLTSESGRMIKTFHGAIWTHDGEVQFPDSNVEDMGPAVNAHGATTDYRGHRVTTVSTPCVRLSTLCEGAGLIDFLHIDVQGSELDLLHNDAEWLGHNVRAMMVATHSRVIEGGIMDLLGEEGWVLKREKPCRFQMDDNPRENWEGLTQADGSQHWINPNL